VVQHALDALEQRFAVTMEAVCDALVDVGVEMLNTGLCKVQN
jgi:hypothetical protein